MNQDLAKTWIPELIPDVPDGSRAPASAPLPAEFAEIADYPPICWDEIPANSANSAAPYVQKAVLPADSILEDWFAYARQHTEGADCYLAGSILPVAGALLGRRVWMQLGGRRKFPNLFTLICGKPGDRKSTTIQLGAALARRCLPEAAFLPANFSPESLFDEFDEQCGGRPDKLWIADDANSVLTDWQKSQNGERIAARFLELYDCAPLSESFRRNKKDSDEGRLRRAVAETSTSLIFGATFNVACFQGQTVRAGLARRFLYYTAERRGCDILECAPHDPGAAEAIAVAFRRCGDIEGEMSFAPAAHRRWLQYQTTNRLDMDSADPLREELISRLASAPAQVVAVAMIFEASMWARRGGAWRGVIGLEALDAAIAHVASCLEAAGWLDGIAHRAAIAEDSEVLYTRILRDFADRQSGPTIYVARSELTRAYCHDSSRRGALGPRDFYERHIPALVAQGKARLAVKDGKREVYGFRAEES